MATIKNIPLNKFRKFLESQGLKQVKGKGGHEKWIRSDLGRPVMLQTHIDPIPEFIIQSNLRTIGATKKELLDFLGS